MWRRWWWWLIVDVVVVWAREYSDDEYKKLGEILVSPLERLAHKKLRSLLADTESFECRELVKARYSEVYSRVLKEDWLPFESHTFKSECPMGSENPKSEGIPAAEIRLCYVLLVHEEPEQAKRLISTLQEEDERHSFVVHVDLKAHETYAELKRWSRSRVLVMESGRANVTWGGFNVVRATLNAMDSALEAFEFDWIVTVSGYTYPLVSNAQIRATLAKYPRDTEFVEIRPMPNEPSPRAWHQFVECDNKMRRIYRLAPPHGIHMYMGSQWMIVTPKFARYVVGDSLRAADRRAKTMQQAGGHDPAVLSDAPVVASSFAADYERYGVFTMVADENFFVTVLKNSPFCAKHENDNFLHVQFDRWENEKPQAAGQKCLQPNPRHCGRSPTTLTLDYLPVLELGGALFARKFDSRKDAAILDAVDTLRSRPPVSRTQHFSNVRLAWRPRYPGGAPRTELCVAVGAPKQQRYVRDVFFEPCDATRDSQRFGLGPCSTDGTIALGSGGPANVTTGEFAPAPFCPIYNAKFEPHDACLDLEREQIVPGTSIIAYACSGRWNQLFGFGAPETPPGKPKPGHVFISVPYAFHKPKELCLEATYPTIKVQECDDTKIEQLFHLELVVAGDDDDDDDDDNNNGPATQKDPPPDL
ncbi:hypothetical protein CTAYLR_002629 [Chrysophaeum taylorii]|uniref:protein xylosyltransferase n=1 Tax=Chrysophaeum taylorii TaxID=2483200 RepID=A0AAD7UEJ7_9STRA|nr:hypothetical protein CTAYLR_002629 [Chrysophaeum taylorii]